MKLVSFSRQLPFFNFLLSFCREIPNSRTIAAHACTCADIEFVSATHHGAENVTKVLSCDECGDIIAFEGSGGWV